MNDDVNPYAAIEAANADVDPESERAKSYYARNSKWATPAPKGYATELPPEDEGKFQSWVKANKVPFDPSPTSDYDMRGYWKSVQSGDGNAKTAVDPNDGKTHYPDTFKTPYHETFSNQSKWATKDAPAWNDKDQLVGNDGRVIFDDRAHGKPAANPYAVIEAKSRPAPIVGTTDAGGQLADDPADAAARGVPGATNDTPVYDPKQAAPAGAIARASLAPDPEVEKQRYSEYYKQPIEDFTLHGDKVIRKTAEGRYVYAEPPDWDARLQSPQKWAASGVGQAIPMAGGALGAAGAAGMATPTTPLGMGVAATVGSAAGGAGGEYIRQQLDHALSPDATPMDWANVGWQAIQQGLGPLGGKVGSAIGHGAVGAGKWTAGKATALAGKLGEAIQNVPGLQGLVAQGKPIVQTVTQAVDDAGTNLLGLTDEARQAVIHHLAGKFDDIKAGIQNARDNWGIDLSVGQATESPVILQTERQQARQPWGAEAFGARRKLQNDEQIPGAMNKFMGEVSPEAGGEAQIGGFRDAADAVVKKAADKQSVAAQKAYGDALDDPQKTLPFTDDLRELFQRPIIQKAWARAQEMAANRGQTLPRFVDFDASGAPKFSDETVPNWRSVDWIKRGLDDIKGSNTNQFGKPVGAGADAASARKELLGIVDPLNPQYKAARAQFGESADAIDQLLEGGVGLIKNMSGPDRQNIVTRVFSGNNLLPEEIGRTRDAFVKAGKLPEWNAGLRAHLQDALTSAITPTQSGESSNVGGKLYKGLWGNQRQENVIKAALGNDAGIIARWNSLGDALRRAAHQLPEGSATATDLPITSGLRGVVGKALSVAKAGMSPSHTAISALQDFASKGQTPEMRRQIVDYMLTTDGDKQLRALQSSMNAMPASKDKVLLLRPPQQRLLGAFLAAAAAHGGGAAVAPSDEPPPGYATGGHVVPAAPIHTPAPRPEPVAEILPPAPRDTGLDALVSKLDKMMPLLEKQARRSNGHGAIMEALKNADMREAMQALTEKIDALKPQSMEHIETILADQIAAMTLLAKRVGAKRVLIKDENGKAIGSQLEE